MAWYKQPIRPYDPVIESDQKTQATRYYRENFLGTGQDSFTNPPAQDQSLWDKFWDNMPVVTGSVQKRWGYQLFNSTEASPVQRMYEFERVSDGQRRLLLARAGGTDFIDEAGVSNGTGVGATSTNVHRVVTSGNYAYFCDPVPGDDRKWDGTDTGGQNGVSFWGINVAGQTSATTQTQGLPSTVADLADHGHAWTSPNNVKVQDAVLATCNVPTIGQSGNTLKCTNYTAFAGISGVAILGIQVVVVAAITGGSVGGGNITALLIKNGAAYGQARAVKVQPTTVLASYSMGGASDLWGGVFAAGDVANSNFGVEFSWSPVGGNSTVAVDAVYILIYYTAGSAIAVATGAAGSVNLSVGRIYTYVFANSTSGHISDIGSFSVSTGPVTNKQINLSTIPVPTDPQVDQKIILATLDGGDESNLYFLAVLPPATTVLTDNVPDTSLVTQNQYLFTDPFGNEFGVAQNTAPPPGGIVCKHRGRIYKLVGENLYFSKNQAELTTPSGLVAGKWEESWPADNFLNTSQSSEAGTGLLSDGENLYIGTVRRVRRLIGDSPDNFQDIENIHNEAGVLSQEVWRIIFIEGSPMGSMWLTPDNRVMFSNFQTYEDIGRPVQDVLDTINTTAAPTVAQAGVFSQGEYDLFVLAIPTGSNTFNDTWLVFDLRGKRWQVWHPTDLTWGMFYNITSNGVPQWLFGASTNKLYQFKQGLLSDRVNDTPVGFTGTSRTSWLHLGSPTMRKWLDEIEFIGDPNMRVTVEGANTQTDFSSPAVIVSSALLTQAPLGTLKIYLAGFSTKYRYYRLTVTSSTTAIDYLDAYNILSMPIHDH